MADDALESLGCEIVLPPKRSLARKVEDLYVTSAAIAFCLFSGAYVRINGFEDFLLGGVLKVFFHALAWPYFAFFG